MGVPVERAIGAANRQTECEGEYPEQHGQNGPNCTTQKKRAKPIAEDRGASLFIAARNRTTTFGGHSYGGCLGS